MIEFSDLTPGQVFELGSARITEAEIIAFASAWDPQPFHLDEAAGRASLFGGLCASGWHTAVILHRLAVAEFISKIRSLGSPGLHGLSWLKPVCPGDTLRAALCVKAKRVSQSRPDVGLIESESTLTNQAGEIVLVQKAWMMVRLGGGES